MGVPVTETQISGGYFYPGIVEKDSTETLNLRPIKFMEIYNDISVELPIQPNLMEVKTEINKVVHRIEDEIGLWRALVTVTVGTHTTTIDDTSDTTVFENETTNIGELGRFRDDYVFDSTEKRLRVPDSVVEVKEVYIDDEEWQQVTYKEVKDSNNSSEKIFHQIGKFIFFPVDLSTATTILKLKVKSMYGGVTEYDGYGIEDATVNIPTFYQQMLISGVLINLSIRQKYKDIDLYKHNKEIFERELVQLKRNYDNLVPTYLEREPTYKY